MPRLNLKRKTKKGMTKLGKKRGSECSYHTSLTTGRVAPVSPGSCPSHWRGSVMIHHRASAYMVWQMTSSRDAVCKPRAARSWLIES